MGRLEIPLWGMIHLDPEIGEDLMILCLDRSVAGESECTSRIGTSLLVVS